MCGLKLFTPCHHAQGFRDVEGVRGQENRADNLPAEVAHQAQEAPGIEKAGTRPKPLRGFQELVKVCESALPVSGGILAIYQGNHDLVFDSLFGQEMMGMP